MTVDAEGGFQDGDAEADWLEAERELITAEDESE
jgi:hypothetical protein